MHKCLFAVVMALVSGVAQAAYEKGDAPFDDLGVDRAGEAVTVSQHRGKVVVVSFWASWCGPCLKELPILENLQRAVGKEHLQVVAINFREDRREYMAMVRRLKGAQMTLTHDRYGKLSEPYKIKGVPFMLVIDRSGRIAYRHMGYSEDMLGDFVDQINGLLDEPVS